MALEAIDSRCDAWRCLSGAGRGVVATLAVTALMGSNKLALAVMPHEVEIGRLRGLLDTLDARYGAGRYSAVTPWGYTDFHIIRVLWPQIDVRALVSANVIVKPSGPQTRRQLLAAYYSGRYAERMEDLGGIDKPIVYVGFRETFSVENLRAISRRVAPHYVERMLARLAPIDHRDSWLWRDPRAHFGLIAQNGHYLAYEVSVNRGNR